MPSRNCNGQSVSISDHAFYHKFLAKIPAFCLRISLAIFLTGIVIASPLIAQDTAPATNQKDESRDVEIQKLKNQVSELQEDLRRVHALLEGHPGGQQAPVAPEQPTTEKAPAVTANKIVQDQGDQYTLKGRPQYTGRPTDPQIALATKAEGGDLSGAGNLLKTDRVVIGGYGDFQFRTPSLSERADGGGTSTFQSTRFVLGVAAVLSQKQNITFNSEIEYELGTSEIDVEQAFISWRARPEFDFRAGIIVPPIGRFNTYHDSNLNITTLRPLINQFIVPTAYRDAGIGVRGVFRLPREMKMSYEANVVNGFQAANADGEATPFSRLLGQSSAAEPGLIAFQATRNSKAVAGRIGFSPILGLEFGVSGYGGTFTNQGDPTEVGNNSLSRCVVSARPICPEW